MIPLSQKATRKTDKPRPEDLDVTELTSEGLKDELLKYGINVGPIVGESVSKSWKFRELRVVLKCILIMDIIVAVFIHLLTKLC